MSKFTHLHVHTQYSLLDGVNRSDKLLTKVKENGMDAVAISDHGSLYGVPEFWKTAKDFGVKPIIGCEIYLAPKARDLRQEVDGIKYYHLLLLAKNLTGYKNLTKIVSISNLEGMYYKPRADIETLKKHSEGLICTSACLAGPLSRHIILGQEKRALEWLKTLNAIYKDNFYLEIQRNGLRCNDEIDPKLEQSLPLNERDDYIKLVHDQIKVNKKLYEYSDQFKIPIIATTDAHYLNPEDKDTQKILFCIKDGKTLDDPRAMNGYVETYIKTPEELMRDFSDIPEVLEETVKISDQIEEFDITYDRVQPQFWNTPKNSDSKEELRVQTLRGALLQYDVKDSIKEADVEKLTVPDCEKLIDEVLLDRLNYELDVIHNKGYDDYFLVVSDIMKWSAKQGILTGVRGSVAGSVVAHCLNIVEIDPIKWELYFERFLNPERPSPPDIDMDIQDSRRDELIDYVKEKYGDESVAAICAIGRLKTKAAIRDVARVMGIDLGIADRLSKMVTVLFGKPFTFEKMMNTDEEFKSIVSSDNRLQELGNHVKNIEGLARHMSVHACGYLITPGPISDYTALQRETGGERVITQWEGPWIEELGLMKFDFLGLRTLTIVADTIKYIKSNKGVDVDYFNIPDDDPEAYSLMGRGETVGIFQFESPPMQKYLIDLQPENQEDLCFMAAAYRPGPMKYIPDYILCKHGKKDPEFLVPELEEIVGYTYGFAIYQEQVIKIAVDLGGYSMGGADILRRAMGKKKMDVMKKEEPIFKKGIIKKGHSKEIADRLWEYLLPFADYGFNKAHAAGYAVLAYKCAYLKAHYPLEFVTALMHADLENPDRIVVDMIEAKRLGFSVLKPDINKSDVYFHPEGEDGIRFGLGAIKNVGVKVCKKIIKERSENGQYKHLDDLVIRVGLKNINKRTAESLIKAGALDEFGDRNALLTILPQVFEKVAKAQKAESLGQADLFSLMGDSNDEKVNVLQTPFPIVDEATDKTKLTWEKELMGMYISHHPLQSFVWASLNSSFARTTEVSDLDAGKKVSMLAMLAQIRIVKTKTKAERMAILTVEDLNGTCSGVIFPSQFKKFEELGLIEESRPYIIGGSINIKDGQRSLIINEIEPANSTKPPKTLKIDLTDIKDTSELAHIKQYLLDSENKDLSEVSILYGSKRNPKTMVRYVDIQNEDAVKALSSFMSVMK